MPTVKHKRAGLLGAISMSLGLSQDRVGSQVGPEAGPSPGVLALSGRQSGWAAVAAPPDKAHTH